MIIREIEIQYTSNNVSFNKEYISQPLDVYNFFKRIQSEIKEHVIALFLNTKNIPLGYELISIGSLNASIIHPREVFKGAILANAHAIILIHNHPSGDSTPSNEDILITNRIKKASEILGIELLDHIIIGFDNYTSLKEKHMV